MSSDANAAAAAAAPSSPPSSTSTKLTSSALLRTSKIVSPRLSGRNLISTDNLPAASQFAMKTLNVTVDGESNLPASVKRSDIAVQVLVSLEQQHNKIKRDEKAAQLAAEIQTQAQSLLRQEFTGTTNDDNDSSSGAGGANGAAPYLLKVYVVLASERSLLHKITLGLIGDAQQECLEWFLQSMTPGQQEICKAGRVGGAGTAELCDMLVTKVGVPK